MLKMHAPGYLSLILLASLFNFFYMDRDAYAQCGTLCMHERGNLLNPGNGIILAQNEEVTVEDTAKAESGEEGDKLLIAADDSAPETTYIEAPSDKWHFSIIPYLWMMGINGEVGVGQRTADMNVSFSDIFKNLDFALQVHVEAWRERFGFFADGTFAKISLTKHIQLRSDNSIRIKNVTKFFLGEIGGFYRVGTWPLGGAAAGGQGKTNTSLTLDILGGGRYWWLDNQIDIRGPRGLLNPSFSMSEDWFDFIVGGRANLAINKFFVQVRSDVGGFGLGFSSDISWNITGYIGYELPWYKITPVIGYRALYDKYEKGSGRNRFLWDSWIYGPEIGVAFQF